jgi:nitrile hydratase
MNGIHDMGGMHGMGPLGYEKNEPVFHAEWEGRVYAMNIVVDVSTGGRYGIELIPARDYLRMSYYDKWLTAMTEGLIKGGTLTREEVQSGRAAPGSARGRAKTPEKALADIAAGDPSRRNVAVAARFVPGQRVRARNINPVTHTRLPRYARGKEGSVERDYGVFYFPDAVYQHLPDKPQHVYSVRFAARELWGAEAPARDSVYIAMWDDYLEPL